MLFVQDCLHLLKMKTKEVFPKENGATFIVQDNIDIGMEGMDYEGE